MKLKGVAGALVWIWAATMSSLTLAQSLASPAASPVLASRLAAASGASTRAQPQTQAPMHEVTRFSRAQMQIKEGHIEGLSWKNDSLDPANFEYGDEIRTAVNLRGHYQRRGWVLFWNNKRVACDGRGDFVIQVPIRDGEARGELKARSVNQVAVRDVQQAEQREKIDLHFPEWKAFQAQRLDKDRRDYMFVPSLGLTQSHYSQTHVGQASESALSASFLFLYPLKLPSWTFGGSMNLTVLPFSKSGTNTPLRFLGANLRAGYVLPGFREPWRLGLAAGLYYTTMLIPKGKYGYQNLGGPQLYPTIRRMLWNGDSLSAYLKYSPVTDAHTLLSFANREIAAGWSWTHPLSDLRSLVIALDYSQMKFSNSSSSITTSSLTLSGVYGF
jgi:hypothetical protein